MTNIIRPDFTRAPFIAEVTFDPECNMWVVSCEELSVTTEAPSYEAMTARFWEIAPEIAELNGIAFDADSRVQFLHTENAYSRPLPHMESRQFHITRDIKNTQTTLQALPTSLRGTFLASI